MPGVPRPNAPACSAARSSSVCRSHAAYCDGETSDVCRSAIWNHASLTCLRSMKPRPPLSAAQSRSMSRAHSAGSSSSSPAIRSTCVGAKIKQSTDESGARRFERGQSRAWEQPQAYSVLDEPGWSR